MGALTLHVSQTAFHFSSHFKYLKTFNYCHLNVSGWLGRIKEATSSSLGLCVPMTSSNARKPTRRKAQESATSLPASSSGELVLHGDISGLIYAFRGHPRRLLTCPVPESIYLKMLDHPGSISQFYEDAVAAFDGDLNALVQAAVSFVELRRLRAGVDPPRNASGRVTTATFEKVQRICEALAEIRGMSRAKVVAGLIGLSPF